MPKTAKAQPSASVGPSFLPNQRSKLNAEPGDVPHNQLMLCLLEREYGNKYFGQLTTKMTPLNILNLERIAGSEQCGKVWIHEIGTYAMTDDEGVLVS